MGRVAAACLLPGLAGCSVLFPFVEVAGDDGGVGGSCAVIVDDRIVPSCLIPVETIEGATVRTLEGLARGNELSPLQAAFVDGFATQCGYCTSGMLMSATALLEENPAPTREDVVRAISGNVCRCTGYEAIIEAILEGARVARSASAAAD